MIETAELEFTRVELNLLIRASEHLIDAYKSRKSPQDKATVTTLRKLRAKFSKAAGELIIKSQ
jgi:hypothetical protein